MHKQENRLGKAQPTQADGSTREKILSAALIEFAQHGLAGARVDRIANRAGVNKAMIYYHFSSKAALHKEIVDEYFLQILPRVRQAFSGSTKLEDALINFVAVYAQAFSTSPEFRLIFLRELANAESEMIGRIAETIVSSGLPKQIVSSFEKGIEQGCLRSVDVRHALVSFILMNVGYFVLAPLIDRIWDIADRDQFVAERKEAIIDLFLHGVKTQ
jgi:TetR/AcrR family transcriptional regulator